MDIRVTVSDLAGERYAWDLVVARTQSVFETAIATGSLSPAHFSTFIFRRPPVVSREDPICGGKGSYHITLL